MSIFSGSNPLLTTITAAGGGGGGYEIERSLRFNSADSAYLDRTPASAGNRKTWTWAGWVKRSEIQTATIQLFSCWTANSNTNVSGIAFNSDKIYIHDWSTWRLTTAVYRDYSAWMHICVAWDSTQATANDRIKLYVNGSQVTTFDAINNPAQNDDSGINRTERHTIGSYYYTSNISFIGAYLADVHFIDGGTPSTNIDSDGSVTGIVGAEYLLDFGEFDDNGIWQPIEYTGTYGTNGFHLPFSDNSTAAALGTDTSGNGNTWTVNNISVTAGAGNDSLVDVPTNGTETDTGVGGEVRGNYATLNPLDVLSQGLVLSNGNLDIADTSGSSTYSKARSTIWFDVGSSDGFYAEFTTTGTSATPSSVGIINASALTNGGENAGAYTLVARGGGGGNTWWTYNETTLGSNSGISHGVGQTLAVAVKNGKVYFAINNTWILSGNPATESNPAFTGLTGRYAFVVAVNDLNSTKFSCNFGQRPFAYTAPSGFKALCTANLDAPVVTKPSTVFDTNLYAGNSGTQAISGLGFSPDLVWIKARNNSSDHILTDVVRGTSKTLLSSSTGAENNWAGYAVTAFNSDGYTVVDTNGAYGVNGPYNYVAWTWDAGSSTVSNTDGSITSSVRANPSAGFSIVTYTGNNTDGATVGHGLGVTPALVITKSRSASSLTGWMTKHSSLASNYNLALNLTDAAWNPASNGWVGDLNSSTVFTLKNGSANGNNVNQSGITYVAYCFAPVDGYSSFGSYTGNGSADGPFVFCNFRPRWVLIKRTDVGGTPNYDWSLYDTSRDPYNLSDAKLTPNSSVAEGKDSDGANTDKFLDILSNGFKIKAANAGINASSGTFIYACFAESPFQYARAR